MRKATIILIAAIYVASIVIVGVFGLEAAPYDEFVFIKNFVIDEINDTPVQKMSDADAVILTYQENLIVYVKFDVEPAHATEADNVTVEIIDPANHEEIATLSFVVGMGWTLRFLKPGQITLRIKSPDANKIEKKLRVYVL